MFFSDISADAPYVKAVRWAASKGIVTGTKETTFAPDAGLTREQAAVMFYRYALAEAPENVTPLETFADSAERSDWALEALVWAASTGILRGSGGFLRPKAVVTRAEAAQLLYNYIAAIASRVFYMDEGGIYEEGTPEEIFEQPKKELTRRFIKQLRVLEFAIDTRDFDFIGAGAEIDRWCLQNDVSPKEKYRIRLAIEELVQQILLPRLPQGPIRVAVEHAEREETTAVTVSYAGARFDPMDTENELSYAVLKSTAAELTYAFDAEKSLQNVVEIHIKSAFTPSTAAAKPYPSLWRP